jgi:hemerythrin
MALIEWSEKLSVNIPSIDGQHKVLIGLINQLHDAMKSGKSKEMIGTVLHQLIDYTKLHFAHEEECMAKTCFAYLKDHQCQHDALAVKVLQLEEAYRSGKAGITMDVLNFLQEWLSGHIMKMDKKYAEHLISNKVH